MQGADARLSTLTRRMLSVVVFVCAYLFTFFYLLLIINSCREPFVVIQDDNLKTSFRTSSSALPWFHSCKNAGSPCNYPTVSTANRFSPKKLFIVKICIARRLRNKRLHFFFNLLLFLLSLAAFCVFRVSYFISFILPVVTNLVLTCIIVSIVTVVHHLWQVNVWLH